MSKHYLRFVASFLLASGLAACGGGATGSVPGITTTLPSTTTVSTAKTNVVRRTARAAATQSTSLAIDAGGAASGSWIADQYYSAGSNVAVVGAAINVGNVTGAAPQAVYQSQRWAPTLTYTIPNLPSNTPQTVRLHFVESAFSGPGKRVFNVAINGSTVLTNFDIFQAAGGQNIAIIKQFQATTDASGTLTIQLNATVNCASIAAIEVISTPTPALASPTLSIDAGGYVSGSWIADIDYTGGQTVGSTNTIDTTHVTDPAPQDVYQRQRWGPTFGYTIPNLIPSGAYTVRLHFAETYFTVPGQRVFNATINGTQVLTNFDIIRSAGGQNIAVEKQFNTTADSNGNISIQFAATFNNATISGIEILTGTSAPTPVPTPIPTTTPPPSVITPGFGPRVPVGPQATVTCPPGSIQLSPGTDVQSVVNANAAGQTYCFATGTYAQQQIVPKSGDSYIGIAGATLDGQNVAVQAFTGSAPGVTIENLVIKNYNNPLQSAAVAPQAAATSWVIQNNEISYNAAAGVAAQSGSKVIANFVHHNNEEGYTIHGAGVIFTDNEISYNNPNDAVSPSFEAGGGKAWATTNLNASYNFSHDNHGSGLWTDTDNQGTVYEYNDVINNWASGIFHEISWDAKIDHNFVRNNASTKYCGGNLILTLSCSEIKLSDSGGEPGTIIDLSYNTVIPSSMNAAIGLASSARGSGLYGTWMVQNVHVHNNTVNLSSGGVTGAGDADGTDTPGMFSSQGNSFDYDSYTGADSTAFYWKASKNSFAAFQAQGQETHGTSH